MSKEHLLSSAPKAIAHLRAQRKRKRLGLIFGSGATKDLSFPNWHQLIELIAAHPHVQGHHLLKRFVGKTAGGAPITRSLASITQILFNDFRKHAIVRKHLHSPLTFLQEQAIKTDWLKIVHKKLYARINKSLFEKGLARGVWA